MGAVGSSGHVQVTFLVANALCGSAGRLLRLGMLTETKLLDEDLLILVENVRFQHPHTSKLPQTSLDLIHKHAQIGLT